MSLTDKIEECSNSKTNHKYCPLVDCWESDRICKYMGAKVAISRFKHIEHRYRCWKNEKGI